MEGVSVIICCYNSAARLPETLRHISLLKEDKYVPVEILLIDNASTDGTAATALALAKQYHLENLHVLHEPQAGLSYARQKGLSAAQYPYIIYCDDDNWLQSDYVLQAIALMHEYPQAGVIGGLGVPCFEGGVKPHWFDAHQGVYAVGPQATHDGVIPPMRSYVFGAASVWRAEALKAISTAPMLVTGRKGGKLTSSDDNEMCYKAILAGYQVVYSSRLRFTHFIPASRLSIDYVKRIKEDSAPGTMYLHGLMYKIGIDKAAFNSYPKRTWWGQSLAVIKHYLQGKSHSFKMTRNMLRELMLMNRRYDKLFK